ncbi:hypothetical protein BCR43DRAFT_487407 [Syncephalastrum racemosum]|uniref:NDT80 domain-containing protein n=1 Tax=Syncephalastrum racemosum TaxID=13706 RepID=A0A1X2HQX3_SYNRA|nr:hypothetical protein BCR43DRAFT_487407 [Syncephalastrum racemosum]
MELVSFHNSVSDSDTTNGSSTSNMAWYDYTPGTATTMALNERISSATPEPSPLLFSPITAKRTRSATMTTTGSNSSAATTAGRAAEPAAIFGPTQLHDPTCSVTLYCRVDRGFFLTDDYQWTCYRRNYFKLSVWINSTLNESLFVRVRAYTTSNKQPIRLIQLTPKRDKGPQHTPAILPMSASKQITWERLQFKSATANNGKKRASQQFYVIVVELLRKKDNGVDYEPVASCESFPVVVRGRSPGHYAERAATLAAATPTCHYRNQNNNNNRDGSSKHMMTAPATPTVLTHPPLLSSSSISSADAHSPENRPPPSSNMSHNMLMDPKLYYGYYENEALPGTRHPWFLE